MPFPHHSRKLDLLLGESPGLVVMGGYSCSKGREFESWHHMLDGHLSHLFVAKIVTCKTKINEKDSGVGPFFMEKN